MSAAIETDPAAALEPPIRRAIPGRQRYRVTTVRPEGETVQGGLSEGVAQSTVDTLMRVMFMQRGPDTDESILAVKIERET